MGEDSSQSWVESELAVGNVLDMLQSILRDPSHLLEIQWDRRGDDPLDPDTTKNTLLTLGYDEEDVHEELMSLRTSDYWKSVKDRNRDDLSPFHVFEKKIQERSVYIKFKIRNEKEKKVFCMSFHFSRYPVGKKPYE